MEKHSPTTRLDAAKRELDDARAECPHWDFENDGDASVYACCARVDDAKAEFRVAKLQAEREASQAA